MTEDTFEDQLEEAMGEDESLESEEAPQVQETKKTLVPKRIEKLPPKKLAIAPKPIVKSQPVKEETVKNRYDPVFQREVIGIVDTLSGEVIDGFSDIGSARAMALMLNNQEKFAISAGYS